MNKSTLTILFCSILVFQIEAVDIENFSPKTDISGQWFLAYNNATEISQFALKRGYFTIKTKMDDVFSVRYTQDITLDKEGTDAGNVEIRLKYLYLKMNLRDLNFLKNNYFEVGLVHRPWLDFEQSVNKYRVQGKMFLERYSIISSADFGLYFSGTFGDKIENKDSGKFGSYAFGIHNGGGYHAIEQNDNKTLEGRISLKPFHSIYQGFQLTYAFTYGKGNTESNKNDFAMNLLFISSETQIGTFTGQYYKGIGDFGGTLIDENDNSISSYGYSVFGELNIPNTNFSLFGRTDYFKAEQTTNQKTYIGGISYKFLKSKVLFNTDVCKSNDETVTIYELALEIGF